MPKWRGWGSGGGGDRSIGGEGDGRSLRREGRGIATNITNEIGHDAKGLCHATSDLDGSVEGDEGGSKQSLLEGGENAGRKGHGILIEDLKTVPGPNAVFFYQN